MKIVRVSMDLIIDEDMTDPYEIATYLTEKLYSDPEFFGDFGQENIVSVSDFS
jgi:hypothetical protein